MSLSSWLRKLASRTRPSSAASMRKPAVSHLEVEQLEERQLLSGGLDPTFAAGGQRTIPLPSSAGTEWATAVAVQKDARIVLAGPSNDGNTSSFTILRLQADGTPDNTFGTNGRMTFQFNGATDEKIDSIAIDPTTQKILVAGTVTASNGESTDTTFAVARLNTDGSLDTTFNGNGMETIEVGGQAQIQGSSSATVTLSTVAIDANGKVLLSGSVYVSSTFNAGNSEQFVVVRLKSDGSVDSNFGTGGQVAVPVNAAGSSLVGGAALALPGDGSIVLAGTTGATSGQTDANYFTVIRLTSAGQLDATFGTGGATAFAFGGNIDNEARAVAALADGTIVVAGSTQPDAAPDGNSDFALARLLPTGQLDKSFNGTGMQTYAFDLGGTNADWIDALAIQSDGKIVAAGTAVTATLSDNANGVVTSSDFALACFNTDGSLDSTFGTGGVDYFGYTIGSQNSDQATAVALQPDGKIVVAGSASLSSSGLPEVDAMAVARVLATNATPSAIGVFDPSTATWYLRDLASAGAPSMTPFAYGGKNWIPVVGDWNGDGRTSVGVFDPNTGTWYLKDDNTVGTPSITAFAYGGPGWIPVVGDWNGDGITTIGVIDPTTETWYLKNSNSPGAPDYTVQYGTPGWKPVVGDWNGDGTTTIGVVDPKTMTWYLRNSNTPGAPDITPFVFGTRGATPVAGDWNGDGITTAGYVSNGTWYLRNSNDAGHADLGQFAYGAGNWVPVVGVWAMPRSPLKAVGGQSTSPVTSPVGQQDLSATVSAALQRMSAAGADPALIAMLSSVKVTFAQLPAGELATVDTTNNQIVLDSNAAGYGWFVDQTPLQDEEFTNGTTADANSPAAGQIDLLSAVMLEMAQLAGLDLVVPALLNEKLAPGQRNVAAVLNVFSGLNAVPTDAPAATNPLTTTAQATTTPSSTNTTTTSSSGGFPTPLSTQPQGLNSPTPITTPTQGLNIPTPLSTPTPGLNSPTPLSTTTQGLSIPTPLSTKTQALSIPTPLSTQTQGLNVPTPLSSGLSTTGSQTSQDLSGNSSFFPQGMFSTSTVSNQSSTGLDPAMNSSFFPPGIFGN